MAATDEGRTGEAEGPATAEGVGDGGTGGAEHATAAERPFNPPVRVVTEDRPSGGSGFATFTALVALAVGLAALTEGWWGPHVPGWEREPTPAAAPQPDPAVQSELRQLAERLGALEQRPVSEPTSGSAPEIQALTERLDALEQRPTGEAANGGTPEIQALTERLAALEQRAGETPAGEGGAAAADLQPLVDRLAALESRVSSEPEETGPPQDPRVDPLSQQVAGLGDTVSSLERQLSQAQAAGQATQQLEGQLAQLRQQVEQLSEQVTARGNQEAQAQALVLASGQLRGALSSSRPFEAELEAVRSLAGSQAQVQEALDAVAPHAGQGIPTRPQLAEQFETLGSRIVRADLRGEGGTWVDHVTGTLSTLVTVRRQGGGIVGNTAEAVVARAEAAVHEGNLAGAVNELAALQGPAAEAAAEWVAAAKARLAADNALETLDGQAISLLNQATGAGGAGAR